MKNKGYTLIELLIGICIAAIVGTSIVAIYSHLTISTTAQKRKMSMQQNGRAALNFIANELLTAGYCIEVANNKIEAASLSGITFTRYLENTDDPVENTDDPERYSIS